MVQCSTKATDFGISAIGSCWRSQIRTSKIKKMRYFTAKGDQGRSSLADGRLISKGDEVFELIGALDEATAHLGMAISLYQDPETISTLRIIQDHLSMLMGLIAGAKIQDLKDGPFLSSALNWIEDKIKIYGNSIENPKGFLFAGRSSAGASIEISRTVVRRAERYAVRYFDTDKDLGNEVLTYLNRLSSFLFVLRLVTDRKSNTQE